MKLESQILGKGEDLDMRRPGDQGMVDELLNENEEPLRLDSVSIID